MHIIVLKLEKMDTKLNKWRRGQCQCNFQLIQRKSLLRIGEGMNITIPLYQLQVYSHDQQIYTILFVCLVTLRLFHSKTKDSAYIFKGLTSSLCHKDFRVELIIRNPSVPSYLGAYMSPTKSRERMLLHSKWPSIVCLFLVIIPLG